MRLVSDCGGAVSVAVLVDLMVMIVVVVMELLLLYFLLGRNAVFSIYFLHGQDPRVLVVR